MAAIVHNSGVNYSLYYNVLNYFKTIMENHPSIQLVTQGNIQDFDTREFPQYPLGNVSITSADIDGTTTNYGIQLIVADKIKNKNNESTPTTNEQTIPFFGVDDTVDIHANTFSIINDLTAYTAKSVDGFEINDTISNEPFEDRFNNGLAGWVSTFTLTVHNDRNRCLFFLINPHNAGYKLRNCITDEIKYAVLRQPLSIGTFFKTSIAGVVYWFEVLEEEDNVAYYNYVNLPVNSTNVDECLVCNPNKFIVVGGDKLGAKPTYYYIPTGSYEILTGSIISPPIAFNGKLVGFGSTDYLYVLGPDLPIVHPTASCDCTSMIFANTSGAPTNFGDYSGIGLWYSCNLSVGVNGLQYRYVGTRGLAVCAQTTGSMWFSAQQQNEGVILSGSTGYDAPCNQWTASICPPFPAPTASSDCTRVEITGSANIEWLRYYPCNSTDMDAYLLAPYASASLCISQTGSIQWTGTESQLNWKGSC